MTTILADAKQGLMCADSSITDGDRVWSGRKVYRIKGELWGFSGDVDQAVSFRAWLRKGGKTPPTNHMCALQLTSTGLFSYLYSNIAMPVESGIDAIGSGSKAAICVYEAIGFSDPKAAVKLVCKHDSGSRTPVRIYRL